MIGVIFRNHCYTEKFDPSRHTRDDILLYDAPNRPRVFSSSRYELSTRLPEIVSQLGGAKVYQTRQRRNYVYVTRLALPDLIYEVYFTLQRAENVPTMDLRLTVESAYPVAEASALPRRPHQIRFAVLAYKILRRQPVRFAPR